MTSCGHECYQHLQIIYQMSTWLSGFFKMSGLIILQIFLQILSIFSLKDNQDYLCNIWTEPASAQVSLYFLFQICVISLCAVSLSLSVFTVALGSSLHPQLMERAERERETERWSRQLSLCGVHYTVDFVMMPCWMASTPSYPCPDATREISGLYRTGLSGIPYICPELVDSRTQIGFQSEVI